MKTRLIGGYCVDGIGTSEHRDLVIDGERIAESSSGAERFDAEYRLDDHVVMAGGIDLHTHIGGGKVNVARLMLPELVDHAASKAWEIDQQEQWIRPLSSPVPGTWETGRRYLEMGYTAGFEPAMLPVNARHAHAEMNDTPWLDTGGYLLLGNDRVLLEWLARGVPQSQINHYVGWMLKAHQSCAIKVVNAGGIDAFKFNQRHLDLDGTHPYYEVTPRQVLRSLAEAIESLGLAHPLHVHCSNLGVAGNIASTLGTIEAVEGRRLHLTHAQFHCYGTDGPHGYSSAASELADRVNADPKLSIDVGQLQFGQTVTLSGDTMHQFANRKLARPRKVLFQDIECQAGCGVLPFRYRHDQYVHGLLWTIGLELFLRVRDPMQVFLTTDHPNGAPFTAYPHLIRLLMSYDHRMSIFERLHPDVRATSSLPSLKREYRLDEIATMTRLGPACALGLKDRGKLLAGALADIAVYERKSNPEEMFARPSMVFRRGKLVYRQGEFLSGVSKATIVARPETDSGQDRALQSLWPERYGYTTEMTSIRDDEMLGPNRVLEVADVYRGVR